MTWVSGVEHDYHDACTTKTYRGERDAAERYPPDDSGRAVLATNLSLGNVHGANTNCVPSRGSGCSGSRERRRVCISEHVTTSAGEDSRAISCSCGATSNTNLLVATLYVGGEREDSVENGELL